MSFGVFAAFMILLSALAYLNPDIGKTGGVLRSEITATYIATSLVFLVTGLTLPLHGFSKVLKNWRVLVLTQSFAFIMFPVIMTAFIFVLRQYPIHQSVLVGFQILSTLPPSVSTASMLTKLVGGNVTTSSVNSVFGSILGLLLTPLFIEWLDHSQEDVPSVKIFQHLVLIAVFPFIFGQLIQNKYRWLAHDMFVINFGQVTGLYCFYARVCNAFSIEHMYHALDWFSLIMTVVMMICFHTVMKLVLLFSCHSVFHYSPRDAVAIMFVASRKSVSLGLPIIATIFGDVAELGYLSLPLIIYSPTQNFIGGLSVKVIKQWLAHQKPRRRR